MSTYKRRAEARGDRVSGLYIYHIISVSYACASRTEFLVSAARYDSRAIARQTKERKRNAVRRYPTLPYPTLPAWNTWLLQVEKLRAYNSSTVLLLLCDAWSNMWKCYSSEKLVLVYPQPSSTHQTLQPLKNNPRVPGPRSPFSRLSAVLLLLPSLIGTYYYTSAAGTAVSYE